jgi:hypothetical protein
MKGVRTVDAFITNVRNIIKHREVTDVPRSRIKSFGGRSELRDAPPKEKTNYLTKSEKLTIWSTPCYLCGRAPAFGIDRVDANKDYTIDNSMPCCSECNYAKKDISIIDFEMHLCAIYKHTLQWIIGDVSDRLLLTSNKLERAPIKATFESTSVIFPSISCASQIIGLNVKVIKAALDGNSDYIGCKWVFVLPREYWLQNMCTEDVINFVRQLRNSKNAIKNR